MTAYNRENFIAEAIESVLLSTYINFELIIVDDCSTDGTVEIARFYQMRDKRIRLYINEKNLGDYPNRNKAASYANGKYLKYLDSDDRMASNCLERMVMEMDNNPDCAFGISSRVLSGVQFHNSENAYRTHFFDRGILDLGPSATIIRNDIFIKENGFLELRCVSDFEFFLRLALVYPMVEIEKDLIFWREHENQEIQLGKIEYLKYSLIILKDKVVKSSLSEVEKCSIIRTYKKANMRYLIKNVLKIGIGRAIEIKSINSLKILDAI
jgi:glycosyltransferase involved in cell wall biosynthesis